MRQQWWQIIHLSEKGAKGNLLPCQVLSLLEMNMPALHQLNNLNLAPLVRLLQERPCSCTTETSMSHAKHLSPNLFQSQHLDSSFFASFNFLAAWHKMWHSKMTMYVWQMKNYSRYIIILFFPNWNRKLANTRCILIDLSYDWLREKSNGCDGNPAALIIEKTAMNNFKTLFKVQTHPGWCWIYHTNLERYGCTVCLNTDAWYSYCASSNSIPIWDQLYFSNLLVQSQYGVWYQDLVHCFNIRSSGVLQFGKYKIPPKNEIWGQNFDGCKF